MSDETPAHPPSPQTQQVVLPFVLVTVLETGQVTTRTNLKDKALVLGLLETAKFQIMLAPPDQPVIQKPHDGFSEGLLRKLRG